MPAAHDGSWAATDSRLTSTRIRKPKPSSLRGQIVVLPPAPAAVSAQPAKPAESLLLERHGDTWVRISASGDSHPVAGNRSTDPPSASATMGSRRAEAAIPVVEIPPAVLVFRDGHTEQIRKYVIVGTTLYTNSDFWSTGSWTRKIPSPASTSWKPSS